MPAVAFVFDVFRLGMDMGLDMDLGLGVGFCAMAWVEIPEDAEKDIFIILYYIL